jgi:hypothetical protein
MAAVRALKLTLLGLAVAGASAAGLAAGIEGCFLPSFELAATLPDAGHDAHEDAGPTGCQNATYPDPPGGMDDGVDVGPILLALRTIDMGDMSSTPGYDLDRYCTCQFDAGPSCVSPSFNPTADCDGPNGIDNALAGQVQLLQLALKGAFGSTYFSAGAEQGRWSLLIQIAGYNGKMDDPHVDVALFPSSGFEGDGGVPAWVGGDRWKVLDSSLGDGGVKDPLYKSSSGYVSQGTLVAAMPTGELNFSGSTEQIKFTFSGAFLTGQLSKANNLWAIKDGVLAGRWPIGEVFKAVSSYRDNNGNPICQTTFGYSTAKAQLCAAPDILVDGTKPKSASCDAISFGFGYSAQAAVIGSPTASGKPARFCDAGVDPAEDHCN